MSASQPALFNVQEFTDNGVTLVGGRLYTYAYGTTAFKTAYTDPEGTIPQTYTFDGLGGQYIALNARGELPTPLYLAFGAYDISLKREDGSTVWTRRADPVRDGVDALAFPAGAGQIGFSKPGPRQTVQQQLDMLYHGIANVRDTRWVGGAKGDKVANDTAAFRAAMLGAKYVWIPPGNYLIDDLVVNQNNFTMEGVYNESILWSTAAEKRAITAGANNSVTGMVLRNFQLKGNATALGGIALGTSNANYCAGAILENVGVWEYSRAQAVDGTGTNGFGVQLGCVQNLTIHNCWIYRNRHQFQRVQGTGYATSVKISGKTGYCGEGYVGAYIDAQIDDLYLDDYVLEGSNNSALIVTKNAVANQRGCSIYMSGDYVEANNETGVGSIVVQGGSGSYQRHVLVMERLNFAINLGSYVTLDRVIATIRSCRLIPSQVTTTVNCDVNFDSCRYPNAGNYLEGYRALLGNITVRDTNDPATDRDLNQINLVNAITFTKIARPVDDPHTLDDYREVVWNPALSSDGQAPSYANLEPAEGTCTKIGRLAYCKGRVRVTISNSGNGTPRITGFPYPPRGLEPATFGLSTAMSSAPTLGYMLSAGALVMPGASYKLTTDGYLVFNVVYEVAE